MICLLFSLGLLGAGALLSVILARRPRAAKYAALSSLSLGCGIGLAPALLVLAGGELPPFKAAWPVPMGEFSLALDPLSAFFLILVLSVGLAAGVYGEGYLEAARGRLSAAPSRFFYLLLTLSMALLTCARNAVLFLTAWEVMALSGFFLICSEDQKPEARRAGLLYLVCTHAGTLCLLTLFAVLGARAKSMDFEALSRALGGFSPAGLGVLFFLALVGFGVKAGFMPLHVWLQEAHPAAPSHVSAVLSGVMLKMGIYGLLRFISLCPSVPESWGLLFLAIGVSSGVLGVLFALAQHDLKRLLAYHSIENIGIIALGMGLGCLGLARHNPSLVLIGFSGAVLHSLNHGLFKSLLFLGAGAYGRALGTRDIEGAGGLLKRMPWTSLFSWMGAAAICGLPPFNGFVSEWLIYYGFLGGGLSGGARYAVFSAAALALIGGLAAACFTKAYGALTLGEPRSETARQAKDPDAMRLGPMAFLAISCLLLGLMPASAVSAAALAAAAVGRLAPGPWPPALSTALLALTIVGALGALLLALTALLWLWRQARLGRREVVLRQPTWGCGFTRPNPRMQYTASSYAQPLTRAFQALLRSEIKFHPPSGYWPTGASFHSHTPDAVLDRALLPASTAAERALSLARRLQHGRLQYYLLYMFLFLMALLLWKL